MEGRTRVRSGYFAHQFANPRPRAPAVLVASALLSGTGHSATARARWLPGRVALLNFDTAIVQELDGDGLQFGDGLQPRHPLAGRPAAPRRGEGRGGRREGAPRRRGRTRRTRVRSVTSTHSAAPPHPTRDAAGSPFPHGIAGSSQADITRSVAGARGLARLPARAPGV